MLATAETIARTEQKTSVHQTPDAKNRRGKPFLWKPFNKSKSRSTVKRIINVIDHSRCEYCRCNEIAPKEKRASEINIIMKNSRKIIVSVRITKLLELQTSTMSIFENCKRACKRLEHIKGTEMHSGERP
ncbi:uncharacterized protein LOC105665264 [Ceratitis capitata]|uniref:uncharacterized protein LOC105665264 n=1 Tax=Ceratitis capitata TaxID=7213 RepID=UPI0006189375|nr:uncharacterized protein LOC105665264 [Ceratitis capitata]